MPHSGLYRALADMVLVLHFTFVAFVVGGLLLILIGGFRGWRWIQNPWFRAAHLLGIAVVVVQATRHLSGYSRFATQSSAWP